MGVAVKMITGDQRAIAIETARQLGMGTHIVGNEVCLSVPRIRCTRANPIHHANAFACACACMYLMMYPSLSLSASAGAQVWNSDNAARAVADMVEDVDGFSGVFPQHKYQVGPL
jgi:magnesium-transporting ATPase (P-type)